ncbi:MAG: HNH endonuclease [Burkholderiales bacterium]|jgi:5-methylcytosine-specific restriction endonuclease McrA|nr:HNH endonuclease [Burkholderiales bacterium]
MSTTRAVDPSQASRTTRRRRELVWAKTAGHCHFCGAQLDPNDWQEDHVVPRMLGGADDPSNLLPICPECNKLRSAKSPAGIRKRFKLGLYAWPEIKRRNRLGQLLEALIERTDSANARKRQRRKSRNT